MSNNNPQIDLFLYQYEYVRQATLDGIKHLTKEQLFMPPIEEEWCIGSYLMHLAECDLAWLQTLSGKEVSADIKERSYYGVWKDCPAEEGRHPKEPIEVNEYLETIALTRKMLLDEVASLKDTNLEDLVYRFGQTTGKQYSKKTIINQMIDHEAHTRGQMLLLIRKAGYSISNSLSQ